jgi:hypothetical protein
VRGHDDGPLFIAQREDVAEQIGAGLVHREIPQLVQEKQRRLGVCAACRCETPSTLGGGQRVDAIHGTGTEDRVALEAGRRAQGGRHMGVAQAHAAKKDQAGLRLETCQVAWRLPLETGHLGGPVPAALLHGGDDGKARQPPAALGGPIVPQVRLACNTSCQRVHV